MINLQLSREDAGRVLAYAKDRRRRAKRGLDKFEGNFDPELGSNLTAGFQSADAIVRYLSEQINEYDRRLTTGD